MNRRSPVDVDITGAKLMNHEEDARGLASPQPVINAAKALETHDSIIVIVDNATALENIRRMANSRGCMVSDEKKSDGIYIAVEKKSLSGELPGKDQSPVTDCSMPGPRVLVLSQDVMGKGDDDLGAILIKSFFHTLAETEPSPDTIIFFNSGVRLVAEGSEVLDDIKLLEQKGKKILACGTCLDFFNIKDKLKAGSVSNMYEIKELMLSAISTINL
jgi:selenium metabolism protein YedF